MNGTIQRAARSVQLAVMATPTRTLADALAAARRVPRSASPAEPVGSAPIAAMAAA